VVRNSVAIAPNVSGQAVDVPVEAASQGGRRPVPHRSRALEYKVKELEARVVGARTVV
jgi:hypothetical protein